MRYLSVCSGIEAATEAWHPLGWTPVAFAEIDKWPSAALAELYPNTPNFGDFTKIEAADVGPIDLLVGGTPCQDFSVAGKRLGLDGARGNLALEFCLLARRLRPRWVVWENVVGVHTTWSGAPTGEDIPPEGWEGDEDSDFRTFLSALEECGYSSFWRKLDAQYVRVESHPRAVPQRRERVFVVGYLGDWRPPAAVLFEPESLRGDSPPRRQAGQGTAPTLAARTRGGGGLGTDFDVDGGLTAVNVGPFGLNDLGGASHSLTARHSRTGRYDPNGETFVGFSCKDYGADAQQQIAPTLRAMGHNESHANAGGQLAVAHSLTGGGFDASEDGTGRGTPIVPIAFDTTQITSKANRCQPEPGGPCHPLSAHAHAPALAFNARQDPDIGGAVTHPLDTDGSTIGVQQGWAVRRLTPTECELIQGFRRGYTAITYRGKPAADGPRYKALGNSKAINCVRWIGERIDLFERTMRRAA